MDQQYISMLLKYTELANSKGCFILSESEVLKRSKDVVLDGKEDKDIPYGDAVKFLIQGVVNGQSKGIYSLDESSEIYKACEFFQKTNLFDTNKWKEKK